MTAAVRRLRLGGLLGFAPRNSGASAWTHCCEPHARWQLVTAYAR
jgi:hypothetical protein